MKTPALLPPMLIVLACSLFLAARAGFPADLCTVRGTVVDQSGAPVAGASVSLGDLLTVTGGDGKFIFRDVQKSRPIKIKAAAIGQDGLRAECGETITFTGCYSLTASAGNLLAVTVVEAGREGEVTLSLSESYSCPMDSWCTSCHTWDPCFEGATLEELRAENRNIPTLFPGVEEMQGFLDRIQREGVDAETYRTCRFQTIHPLGTDMRKAELGIESHPEMRFRYPEALSLCEGRYTQCETCHTRHLATTHGLFLNLSTESNELCRQCHL